MLTQLTKEQIATFPRYVQMGLELGLQQGKELPSDEKLLELFAAVYREGGIPAPTHIIRAPSPLAGAIRAAQVASGKVESVEVSSSEVTDILSKASYGTQDISWLSFYMFFLGETNVKGPEKLIPLMNLCKEAIGWWWAFEKVVIVTPVPSEIHMKYGRLHNSNGAAIIYPDGYSLYALNGVRFSGGMEKFITTPIDSLNLNEVLNIVNAEQRAEVIKRIGVEKFIDKLRPVLLDTNGSYQLLEVTLGNYRPRKYLKMLNPSVAGEIHIEAVHPECNTINQALNFRNFGLTGKAADLKFLPPEELT